MIFISNLDKIIHTIEESGLPQTLINRAPTPKIVNQRFSLHKSKIASQLKTIYSSEIKIVLIIMKWCNENRDKKVSANPFCQISVQPI